MLLALFTRCCFIGLALVQIDCIWTLYTSLKTLKNRKFNFDSINKLAKNWKKIVGFLPIHLLTKICLILLKQTKLKKLDLIFFFIVYRKLLLKEKLVAKQMFTERINDNTVVGSLLHLPRFFIELKSKFMVLTEQVCNILKSSPHGMAESSVIRSYFDKNLEYSLSKLFKMSLFQKYVITDSVSIIIFILYTLINYTNYTNICNF